MYQGKLASSSLQVFFRTRPIFLALALGLDGATATVAFGCLCLHSYTIYSTYLGRHVYIGEITEAAACDSASCTRKQHQCYNEGNTWCSCRYDMPQHKLPRVALG